MVGIMQVVLLELVFTIYSSWDMGNENPKPLNTKLGGGFNYLFKPLQGK